MTVSSDAVPLSAASGVSTVRVLHLHSGNMIGGVESMLRTLAEYAPCCPGFQQEIALAFRGAFADALRASGMRVHLLPSAQLRNPLTVLRSRRALGELLADETFDAVISHSPWVQAIYGPTLKAKAMPVLYWMHNAFDGHWLQKLASRHVPDFAICNSGYSQSTLSRIYGGVPSTVIHYPVKLGDVPDTRDSLRRELHVTPETVVILMASRMDSWKGHLNLLRAAAQLDTIPTWAIWIAGAPQTPAETQYYDTVVREMRGLDLQNRVQFLGHRSDVPALMRAADIFCHPNSQPEPFGIVFIEALHAGVPVVTFAMGGPNEILDANTGFLVPPGDISSLAGALKKLVEDPSLRARSSLAGPARAKLLCDPVQQIRRLSDTVVSVLQGVQATS